MKKDDSLNDFLVDVNGIVQASSYERHSLWRECTELGYKWKEEVLGTGRTIGKIANSPVFITLWKVKVNDTVILFIDATSQIVDYNMIDEWVESNAPDSAKINGVINKSDPLNFHNVLKKVKK